MKAAGVAGGLTTRLSGWSPGRLAYGRNWRAQCQRPARHRLRRRKPKPPALRRQRPPFKSFLRGSPPKNLSFWALPATKSRRWWLRLVRGRRVGRCAPVALRPSLGRPDGVIEAPTPRAGPYAVPVLEPWRGGLQFRTPRRVLLTAHKATTATSILTERCPTSGGWGSASRRA